MTTKFQPGDKITHPRFGDGVIREVFAVAQNPDEETEYVVKLRGERYPATLGETSLEKR